jgi:cob(I)alamin adenosyltransferase
MLYTRKGDAGTTKLFTCNQNERISKSALIFEVLGSVDELNSMIGYAKVLSQKERDLYTYPHQEIPVVSILERIQQQLFCLQAELAGSDTHINPEHIEELENIIRNVEKVIPPIHTFILSGGSESSAYLDITRTYARKTERKYVHLINQEPSQKNQYTSAYLNRLSSTLYALARFTNYQLKQTEQSPTYI